MNRPGSGYMVAVHRGEGLAGGALRSIPASASAQDSVVCGQKGCEGSENLSRHLLASLPFLSSTVPFSRVNTNGESTYKVCVAFF